MWWYCETTTVCSHLWYMWWYCETTTLCNHFVVYVVILWDNNSLQPLCGICGDILWDNNCLQPLCGIHGPILIQQLSLQSHFGICGHILTQHLSLQPLCRIYGDILTQWLSLWTVSGIIYLPRALYYSARIMYTPTTYKFFMTDNVNSHANVFFFCDIPLGT